jgi:hypothetical protein
MKEGLKLLHTKLIQAIRHIASFAQENASIACLSYTHFQPAQPTTVGKRACLWLQDLLMDLHDFEEKIHSLRFLGAKGATGTQSSFLSLFNDDHHKVKQLDLAIAKAMGFEHLIPMTEFRDWLKEYCYKPENRMNERRNGQNGVGPLTFDARKILLEKLDAAGFPKSDLLIVQSLVNMEKSDLFDVLEYVFNGNYSSLTREERVAAAQATIFAILVFPFPPRQIWKVPGFSEE